MFVVGFGNQFYTLSELSNYTGLDTKTFPENAVDTLEITGGAIQSGKINVDITSNSSFDAVTTLKFGGLRIGGSLIVSNLPYLPNLSSVSLASSWSGYLQLVGTTISCFKTIRLIQDKGLIQVKQISNNPLRVILYN